MLQKGFLISRLKSNSNFHHRNAAVSRIILFLGILILISSLIFMITNLEKADSIVMIWLPFMIAGVLLVFISLGIRFFYEQANRKVRHNILHDQFLKSIH
jgi:uncharacterized integral membrane protein